MARFRLAGILAAIALGSCASNPRLERLSLAAALPGGRVLEDPPWTRHQLDNPGLRLPNGLGAIDAEPQSGHGFAFGNLAVVWFENPER